jgi:hypothetical protein
MISALNICMNVIFWNGGIEWGVSRTIGPYKVAYWLRKNNYSAQVLDFVNFLSGETVDRLTRKFITSETRVLAISTTFLALTVHKHSDGVKHWLSESLLNVLKNIKRDFPNIKIVLGGYKSEKVSGLGIVDATVMSYTTASEEIFLEYMNYLTTGSEPPESVECYWDPNKRPVYNKARNPVYNIEVDDFKWSLQDAVLQGEPLPLDISRGCIFACRFCQYPHLGKKKLDYIRGMEFLKEEILYNYENFGTTSYYIIDDTFNDTETKMKAFYDMTQTLPFKINYTGYIRADLVHRFPDTAYYLKESGLYGAFFGIESLHPEASKIVGKAWSGKTAKEFIPKLYHDIWNHNVPVHTNFIVGITGETLESVNSTANWFIQNNLHSIVFERLGLNGPEEGPIWSIKSEFDKNSSKYGFTMLPTQPNKVFADWKNDNWTSDSASYHADRLNNMLENHRKVATWSIPTLLWANVSKNDIENKKRNDYPPEFFGKFNHTKIVEYIKTVQAL